VETKTPALNKHEGRISGNALILSEADKSGNEHNYFKWKRAPNKWKLLDFALSQLEADKSGNEQKRL
jgi:hypothetical protein